MCVYEYECVSCLSVAPGCKPPLLLLSTAHICTRSSSHTDPSEVSDGPVKGQRLQNQLQQISKALIQCQNVGPSKQRGLSSLMYPSLTAPSPCTSPPTFSPVLYGVLYGFDDRQWETVLKICNFQASNVLKRLLVLGRKEDYLLLV